MENENIVYINKLTKKYSGFTALNNIDLEIPKGKIIGLLGPNGSGKTTFIKVLANLLMKYEGVVLIYGKEMGKDTKKVVAYLPDKDCLDKNWTFKDAIIYFKDFFEDFDENKAIKLANELNIPINMKFKSLSKGTREKLQLILILSRKAKLYLFDEPIAGVDPVARDIVFKLITENISDEASAIISTHLILDIEDYLDYVIFIKNGEVVLRNDVKQLKESTGKTINEVFKEVFRYERY